MVVAVGVWAFLAWPLPWPGLAAGIGLTLLTILVWALFLSPRPVLRTDRFGLGLIELLFIGAGVAALLGLGTPWLLAAAFGLIAAALGYRVPERLR